jgi:D-alanyl-D-alanine carboxypeptidase
MLNVLGHLRNDLLGWIVISEISDRFHERIRVLLASLNIPPQLILSRSLVLYEEATDLVIAEVDRAGRQHLLIPSAVRAWLSMKAGAFSEGVELQLVSAFRSVDRQTEIVQAKLNKGLSIHEILNVNAPPGYSEHHTGRAVDLSTTGARPLDNEFDATPAFQWLSRNAWRFDFFLSYPADNAFGYAYEPWHWCYRAPESGRESMACNSE